MNAPQRTELVLTAAERTPWGIAQGATSYGPGLVFYYTMGHGGFHVEPDLLATMPEPYRSIRPFCGQAGWYEEDCDWAIVALSFPDRFTPDELAAARDTFNTYHPTEDKSYRASCPKRYPHPAPARREEGADWICTGNFDGFTCGSDADPGL